MPLISVNHFYTKIYSKLLPPDPPKKKIVVLKFHYFGVCYKNISLYP